MTHQLVIEKGLGQIAGPHGSPSVSKGNTVISVDVHLRANRIRTEFFELTPREYADWTAARSVADWAAMNDFDVD